jgi:hypothetical protein
MDGHTMLYMDYFTNDATYADNFRKRYMMSKDVFMLILHGMSDRSRHP